MENRTYDHYLGSRSLLEGKPGDGLVEGMMNPDLAGNPVPIVRSDDPCVFDPPHGWDASRMQFNGGLNDGFVRAYEEDGATDLKQVMSYMTREELPIHNAIADAYTSFDRWHSSLMGPTWPNRMYLFSGQSGGMQSNMLPTTAGGFDWPSFMGHLAAASVEWKSYFATITMGPLFADAAGHEDRFRPMAAFFDDAAEGSLPAFCMIEPEFYFNDDHPPGHPILGQMLIASIYASLAESPQWNECLFVVTYDEHGGFFDHVPPPTMPDERAANGFDQLGFRVPALAMGPWVKQGHVSSVLHDHTSVLKHLWGLHGLQPLTMRDEAATDLSDCLDLPRMMAGEPREAIALPSVMVDESTLPDDCFTKIGGKELTIFDAVERKALPPWADRRHDARAQREAVAENLARYGRGGIRRGW
jgi:phospholipase C